MNFNVNFTNEFCNLIFRKQSLRGRVRDYVIYFNDEETDIQTVLSRTQDVFQQLILSLSDSRIKGRIVAEIEFMKINDDSSVITYHFTSYQAEFILDCEDFYRRHWAKIISRLDQFNHHGSNLLIKRIKHIHLPLNVIPLSKTR